MDHLPSFLDRISVMHIVRYHIWHMTYSKTWALVVVIISRCCFFNPRTAWGGYPPPPPIRFFVDSEKRRRYKILHSCTYNTLIQCCKFWPPDLKGDASRSHYVTWPEVAFFQSLRVCQRHIKDPSSLKFAVCNTDIGIYDLYISDFLYRWPQVMSISWPPHYMSMVRKWSTSNAHQICPIQSES